MTSAAVGYIILARRDAAAVARLAQHLIHAGSLVAIHLDEEANDAILDQLRLELGPQAKHILWPSREGTAPDQWTKTQAVLTCIKALADSGRTLDFVHLMGENDYPIRPIEQFQAYLGRQINIDFVQYEATSTYSSSLSSRAQDTHSAPPVVVPDTPPRFAQMYRTVRRWIWPESGHPAAVEPRADLQTWTLSWRSALALLQAADDPNRKATFQARCALSAPFAPNIVGSMPSFHKSGPLLTLAQLDDNGRPITYYDDHATYLASEPFFFVHNLSHGARTLRSALDDYILGRKQCAAFADDDFGQQTDQYRTHQKRAVCWDREYRLLGYERDAWLGDLAYRKKPLVVVYGASHADLTTVASHLNSLPSFVCHGALFHPDRIEFASDAPSHAGYRSDDVAIRDQRRTNFLSDVALETDRNGIPGFLAPWGMDGDVCDRLIRASYARSIVVHGGVRRATEEWRDRLAPASLPSGPGRPSGSGAAGRPSRSDGDPTSDAPDMSQTISDYYENLCRELRKAGASFIETDLEAPGWRDVVSGYLANATRQSTEE